ncbi:substrate-binding periplasmic protein [Epibacterium sp. Ofav1-8]|uniref:substrate-binding periplasmic protein n=1 Tax=Epibacterium sp. Ofav1-8 TaxID=2917735 RepID=UPI001EF70F1F|nr:transporter substrate-binding domain-containing protein [Epibacterium sp. Ofav1-8]MCG7624813.1 transporter substrate-binding domain-containing protein [Epibacterium sp. Ofav1-8]
MKLVPTFATALFLGLAGGAQAADVMLFTEDYAPLNFERDGEIVGLGADQVFEMMDRAGISYEVELTQWSRAIGQAERRPNTCVFSTTHTEERDPNFKWVEPLASDSTILVRKAGSDVAPATIEEAAAYRTGSQTGDYTVGVLEEAGFQQIDLAPNQAATVKKLLQGRIDLMATSGSFLEASRADGVEVEEALVLSTTTMSLACSLKTDQELVDRMQAALQSMIDDGTQAEIAAKYE